MIWEIANTPHRLLSSMPVLPANVPMPGWLAASLEGMERFVFETDFRSWQAKLFGVDETRAHLKWFGASEIYRRAIKFLNANGVDGPLDAFLPWQVANSVSRAALQKHGFFSAYGIENRLRLLADDNKFALEFFESNTRSSELMDKSCKQFRGGLAYLKKVIADAESGASKSEMERMLQAWLSSDIAELIAINEEEFATFPFIIGVHHQRNREWVSVAKKLISEQKPTLFVMGTNHTVGKGSFIEQMENEGFRFNFIA